MYRSLTPSCSIIRSKGKFTLGMQPFENFLNVFKIDYKIVSILFTDTDEDLQQELIVS